MIIASGLVGITSEAIIYPIFLASGELLLIQSRTLKADHSKFELSW